MDGMREELGRDQTADYRWRAVRGRFEIHSQPPGESGCSCSEAARRQIDRNCGCAKGEAGLGGVWRDHLLGAGYILRRAGIHGTVELVSERGAWRVPRVNYEEWAGGQF